MAEKSDTYRPCGASRRLSAFYAKDAEFAGADGLADEAISEINPDYEPWFSPIFEPKSGEIESLLFALQAAIGAGIIGFITGRMTKKAQ